MALKAKRRELRERVVREGRLIRVNLGEGKTSFVDALSVYRGEFVEPEEFEEVFENAEEIFKFFENDIILGAVIDSRDRKVHFITLSTDHEVPYTTLEIWTAEIE